MKHRTLVKRTRRCLIRLRRVRDVLRRVIKKWPVRKKTFLNVLINTFRKRKRILDSRSEVISLAELHNIPLYKLELLYDIKWLDHDIQNKILTIDNLCAPLHHYRVTRHDMQELHEKLGI